jgi:hypothetical protein
MMLLVFLYIVWNIFGLIYFMRKKQFPRTWRDHAAMFGLNVTLFFVCVMYEAVCAFVYIFSFGMIDMGGSL